MKYASKNIITNVPVGAPCIGSEEIHAVLNTLREKRLSQGKLVKALEKAWAAYIGRRCGIAVNSGSSANLVALQAMKEYYGWQNGSEVIVPALTFVTAVMPVLQSGLKPRWVDVDERGNMTLESIKRALGRRPKKQIKGLVLVHSLGLPCLDAGRICNWARKNGIAVLEDGCESHGAIVARKKVGAFGDLSTTSFYVAHNMTTGEGGMIATDNPELDKICRSLREFGRRIPRAGAKRYVELASGPRYDIRYAFDRLGYNLRMTDITASIGLVQLKKLDRMNARRRRIVEWYRKELAELIRKGKIALPDEPAGTRNSYYTLLIIFRQMPKLYPSIEKVAICLERAGIETRPFMAGNLLRQKAFAGLGQAKHYPGADFLHHQSLFVGCHPLLNRRQIKHVCRNLEALFSC